MRHRSPSGGCSRLAARSANGAGVIGALARAVRPNVGDGAALLRGVDSGARKCRRVARASSGRAGATRRKMRAGQAG
ncbi:hypothetical protein AQ910_22285 [Burkholderia pseudomallei]|nr:hypothetical protein AQ910_22285 [Burkholderia pseudomallei]